MKLRQVDSYSVRIWMAGEYEKAVEVCRQHCDENPWCVSVTPTKYTYTGGEDDGFVVGLINYPRFPCSPARILTEAEAIADRLREALRQESYTIETPEWTTWYGEPR